MTEIIEYTAQYHPSFKQLNLQWLEQYHLLETHDVEVLDEPEKYILAGGGLIYLALENGQVVGSAALIHMGGGEFELAKMAVAPAYRGRGISRALMDKCLSQAGTLQAKKVILYSNSQLKAAIALYEKYGFKHVPVIDSPFVTADVKMELSL